MSAMFKTLLRTVVLDDKAYQEWRERPNLFLRGIVLIAIVTLVAGIVVFGVNLVNQVKPVDVAAIEDMIQQGFNWQYQWNPGMQNMPPEMREQMDQMLEVLVPMVTDITQIPTPLPRGISGFFVALGTYLSRVLAALGGWMLYGALVLVAANLLGGGAKLPHFLGMTSLYAVPGLLGVLQPVPCAGGILALIGTIWSIVVYVKAVSVACDLDTGRSILAVIAPFLAILLLSILLVILFVLWMVALF